LVRDLPPPEDADLRPRSVAPAGEDGGRLLEAACRAEAAGDLESAERMIATALERPVLFPEGEERASILRCLDRVTRRLTAWADETGDGDVYGRLVRLGRRTEAEARSLVEWMVGSAWVRRVLESEERRQKAGPERLWEALEGLPDPRSSLAEAIRHEYVRSVRLLEDFRREVEGKPWPVRLFYRHGRTLRLLAESFRAFLRDLDRSEWEARCQPRAPVGGLLNFYGRRMVWTLCPAWGEVREALRRESDLGALERPYTLLLRWGRQL